MSHRRGMDITFALPCDAAGSPILPAEEDIVMVDGYRHRVLSRLWDFKAGTVKVIATPLDK